MLVTPSGIVIDVRLMQQVNAVGPIVVTELGIVTEVRLSQAANVSG